jgi:hypothetical protein
MSVTIKGDTTQLLGEHLPTPYIDRIVMKGIDAAAQMDIHLSIHVPHNEAKYFAYGATLSSQDRAFRPYISALKYYIALSTFPAADKPLWEAFHEEVVKGNPDANPLMVAAGFFERSAVRAAAGWRTNGKESNAPMLLFEVDFTGVAPTQVYSEDGDEIWKYTVVKEIDMHKPYDLGPWIFNGGKEGFDEWAAISNMNVYAFSSTIDYRASVDSLEIYGERYRPPQAWATDDSTDLGGYSIDLINASGIIEDFNDTAIGSTTAGTVATRPLLSLETSAIAYEKVIEDGVIADKANVEYFDSDSSPYPQIPLVAIDSAIYKVNRITHAQIVDKIQKVLDRYRVYYDKDRGYDNLKNMYNGISTIIATQANDPYLLPRLATFQRAWPHKLPAKPVGKLYKDFRKNIFAINKTIKQAERLYPRIRYSAKVIDERPWGTEEVYAPLYKSDWESNIGHYIYNANFLATKMNIYYDATELNRKDVVYGMAFFDYEKALTYTCDASRVLNVQKLESWGMPILYSQFYVTNVRFIRQQASSGGSLEEDVRIISYMAGSGPPGNTHAGTTLGVEQYPSTKWVRVSDLGLRKKVRRTVKYDEDDDYVNALMGTPYYPEESALQTELIEGTTTYGLAVSKIEYHTVPDPGDGPGSAVYGTDVALEAAHEEIRGFRTNIESEYERANAIAGHSFTEALAQVDGDGATTVPPGWPHDYWEGAWFVTTDFNRMHYDTIYGSTWTVMVAGETSTTTDDYWEYFGGTMADGYLTSTTLRPFTNLGADLSPTIDNYRLMCFDLLDYQVNSYADTYDFRVAITDKTSEIPVQLMALYKEALSELTEYYNLCIEQCSYNSDTQSFNDFFKENIVTYYDEDIEKTPWYRLPFIYCLHRDLYYNTFQGDMEKIKEAAINISQRINPASGTLNGVEMFHSDMTALSEAIYEHGGVVWSALVDMSATVAGSDAVEGTEFGSGTLGFAEVANTKIFRTSYDMPESYETMETGVATLEGREEWSEYLEPDPSTETPGTEAAPGSTSAKAIEYDKPFDWAPGSWDSPEMTDADGIPLWKKV